MISACIQSQELTLHGGRVTLPDLVKCAEHVKSCSACTAFVAAILDLEHAIAWLSAEGVSIAELKARVTANARSGAAINHSKRESNGQSTEIP